MHFQSKISAYSAPKKINVVARKIVPIYIEFLLKNIIPSVWRDHHATSGDDVFPMFPQEHELSEMVRIAGKSHLGAERGLKRLRLGFYHRVRLGNHVEGFLVA